MDVIVLQDIMKTYVMGDTVVNALDHGLAEEKIGISALLHDCGREIASRDNLAKSEELGLKIDKVEKNQPILLHALW